MKTPKENEHHIQQEITRLFLVEIMNNMGVVAAGKIFNRVNKQVKTVEDPLVRLKLHEQIESLKALYIAPCD